MACKRKGNTKIEECTLRERTRHFHLVNEQMLLKGLGTGKDGSARGYWAIVEITVTRIDTDYSLRGNPICDPLSTWSAKQCVIA